MSLMNTLKKAVKPAVTRAIALTLVLAFVVNAYAVPVFPQYMVEIPTANMLAVGITLAVSLLGIGLIEAKVPAVRKLLN